MHTAKQPEITLHGATFSSVCVCVTLGIIGILSDCFELLAGGRSRCKGLRLTKLPCIWEAEPDQLCVPA